MKFIPSHLVTSFDDQSSIPPGHIMLPSGNSIKAPRLMLTARDDPGRLCMVDIGDHDDESYVLRYATPSRRPWLALAHARLEVDVESAYNSYTPSAPYNIGDAFVYDGEFGFYIRDQFDEIFAGLSGALLNVAGDEITQVVFFRRWRLLIDVGNDRAPLVIAEHGRSERKP